MRSTTWQAACHGGLPLLILVAAFFSHGIPAHAQGECFLRFSISEELSGEISVGGSVSPGGGLPSPPLSYGGSPPLFLSGDLFLTLPPALSAADSSTACQLPSSLEELLVVLPNATLTRPSWASPVTLWPNGFRVLDFAGITGDMFNVTLAMTTEASEAAGAEGSWAPPLLVTMESMDLQVVVPPAFQAFSPSTNVSVTDIVGDVTAAPLTFEADEAGPGRVVVRVPVEVDFTLPESDSAAVVFSLSTQIYAEAVLGCDPPCGRTGRCALNETGSSYCECMCGWGGAMCTEPELCPSFRSQSTLPTPCLGDPTVPVEDEEEGEAPLTAYQGVCPATQMPLELSVVEGECGAQECECLPGFDGPGCSLCSTDEACQVWARRQGLPKASTSTCDTAMERTAASTLTSKEMYCEATTQEMAGLLGFLTVDCWANTTLNGEFTPPPGFLDNLAAQSTGSTPELDPTKNMCLIKVQVTITDTPVLLQCNAFNCEIARDSMDVACFGSICPICEGQDCAAVGTVLDDLTGAAILCDGNNCDVELSGSSNIPNFAATCRASQCVVEDGSDDEQKFDEVTSLGVSTMNRTLPAILAWAVIIGIAALWVAYGLLSLSAHRHATNKVHADDDGVYDVTAAEAPCTLSFSGLTVEVAVAHSAHATLSPAPTDEEARGAMVTHGGEKAGKRSILVDLNGQLRSGSLTGLMGPSGSGKTTLLNALMKRTVDLGRADVHGSVKLNGTPLPDWFPSIIGYVPQFDQLMPGLTCRELITFSANLRLPAGTSQATIESHVEETLAQLGIQGVADSIAVPAPSMGSRGISGGEQRRVAVALELVVKPQLLFLDEATSGLDSFRAESLVRSLRAYAHGPGERLVVLTVHQPSPTIFAALDGVICLLAGRLAFHGAPTDVLPFFSARGHSAPMDVSAPEHMLAVINAPEVAALVAAGDWLPVPDKAVAEGAVVPDKETAGAESVMQRPKPHTLAREAWLIWSRSLLMLVRSPALVVMHWVLALLVGTLMGVAFLNVQTDISGVQNRNGALFFALVFLSLASLSTVDVIFTERAVVRNEALSGHYSPVTYALIKGVIDAALLRVIPALLLSLPFYYLMGLHRDPAYAAIFMGVVPTFSAAAGLLSLFLCTVSNTPGSANLLIIVVLLLFMLFGGLIANLAVMPDAVVWISYLSIFRYAFEALLGNELDGQKIIPKLGDIELDIVLDGNGVIEQLGLSSDHVLRDIILLNLLTVLLWIMSGLSLWVRYVAVPKRQKHRY